LHRLSVLERKINSRESEHLLEDMRVMYRTKLVEDEVKLLEQDNLIKDLEANQLKRRMALTVMLIGFLILAAGFLVFLWLQKSKSNRIIQERNRRLDEMNVELLSLNKTKDRLFSIIGHDLKNPINTIMGFNDLMNSKDGNDTLSQETRTEYMGHISDAIRHVSELLDNLLEWSRTQQKTTSFKQQQLDLNELIRENLELVRASAEKKSIKLEAQLNEPVMVIADDNMVNTVLRNLISNAVKFTSESGTIQIRTKEAAKTVDVFIEDTGVGMSEEEIKNLFQVDMSVSRKGTFGEPGTGLGLLICKEFVEKHNGAIHVTSKPGKGSTFSFDLPKANA
jgi:two-component system, sensor histidine kinase and response regulator